MVQVIVSKETAAQIMGVTPKNAITAEDYENLVIPYTSEGISAAFNEPEISTEQLLHRLRTLESQR